MNWRRLRLLLVCLPALCAGAVVHSTTSTTDSTIRVAGEAIRNQKESGKSRKLDWMTPVVATLFGLCGIGTVVGYSIYRGRQYSGSTEEREARVRRMSLVLMYDHEMSNEHNMKDMDPSKQNDHSVAECTLGFPDAADHFYQTPLGRAYSDLLKNGADDVRELPNEAHHDQPRTQSLNPLLDDGDEEDDLDREI